MRNQEDRKNIYSDLIEASDTILEYTQEQAYFTRENLEAELATPNSKEIIDLLEGEDILRPLDLQTDEITYSGTRFKTGRYRKLVEKLEEKYGF